MVTETKVPIDFLRKYLRAKGYKETFHFWCECDPEIYYQEEIGGHPVRWLWEHVQKGHEPSFDCCHSWDRAVGHYFTTGEKEEWYRWYSYTWSQAYQDWLVSDSYQGRDGHEEPSPPECWRRAVRAHKNAPVVILPSYSDAKAGKR